MATPNRAPRIVVGVDGSEASVEALRQAQRLAVPLGAQIEATGCWQYPQMYVGQEMMGIKGFQEQAGELLEETVVAAFGPDRPGNVWTCLLHGSARELLIDASRDADLLVVGRRGQGGFGGRLLGSVSSACVAHAQCPVLVVHAPAKDGKGP